MNATHQLSTLGEFGFAGRPYYSNSLEISPNMVLAQNRWCPPCACDGIMGPCDVHQSHPQPQHPVVSSRKKVPRSSQREQPSIDSLAFAYPVHPSPNQESVGLLSPPAASSNDTTRMNFVLGAVKMAGFETLDAMLTSFYTTRFEKHSDAEVAQRASRSRHLSRTLAALFESSRSWTMWESRSYHQEILRESERLYAAEFAQLLNDDDGRDVDKGANDGLLTGSTLGVPQLPTPEHDQCDQTPFCANGSPQTVDESLRHYQNKACIFP